MELNEIKELIGGGLVRDVVKVRAAWIAYGGLLAECPHKQGAKIGQWVREQGLDFVSNPRDRSAAIILFNFLMSEKVNLTDCPHLHPRNVIQWLNDTGQIEGKRKASDAPKVPRKSNAKAITAMRGEIKNAIGEVETTVLHYLAERGKLPKIDDRMTPLFDNLTRAETWRDAVKEGNFEAKHGEVIGIAKGLRIRLVVELVDVEVKRVADGTGSRVIE